MEQNTKTLTATQFNEAAGANPGNPATAEAYEAGKATTTDVEAAGDAALSGISFPDKAALQAATANLAGNPDEVAAQVAAEVDQHWTGYQQGQFTEAHGTDPVTAARTAVEAAQAQGQPPQPPVAPAV
ncbi:MAG TPA: hypothetical protein VLH86_03595 [Patescibacteria group bacterium]|nr:hypothetical protein [Patescibacteria group bacterium]